jgi:TPR repeat protein
MTARSLGQRWRRAVLALAALSIAGPALAETWTAPAPSPALQAAMKHADAGDPAPLVKLADSGDANAQYYAGVMYIFGRGQIAKDGVRGCAYEEKAAAHRADAMHLVGRCYQTGVGGAVDKAKAEAAYQRATQMGFPQSKCALGQMLLSEPGQGERGLALCKEAGAAGEIGAQVTVANAYDKGVGVKRDPAAAREWYGKAAQQDPNAARRLGEMWASGDGGKKDTKKALELWMGAEKAGDPLSPILVADQLFSDVTGGKKPEPGKYAFKGGVPVADLEVIEHWYREAADRDPRPDVKKRANYALSILASLKTAKSSGATH